MKKPFRIIVWGPSNLGGACIREIQRLPDFELAGVFAFSPQKNGQDVGTLIGTPPIGIKATTDRDAVFAMEADCVLYTGHPPFDQEALDRDIIRLLESGKNVVSATSHFHPPYHGQAYVDRIEAACKKGNTSIHGTGENPGFMLERLGLTLSGLTNTVERIAITESVFVGKVPGDVMPQYGLNVPPEQARNGPVSDLMTRWGFVESATTATLALFGRKPDRVEYKPVFPTAENDIVAETITIKKGMTRSVRHVVNAIVDGKVRVTMTMIWFLLPEDAAFKDQGGRGDKWMIEIEGMPSSLRVTVDAMASIDRNEDMHPGDPTIPSYYVTVPALLQAVPIVCAAPPGIVYPTIFANSVDDFQRLATRKTLVN